MQARRQGHAHGLPHRSGRSIGKGRGQPQKTKIGRHWDSAALSTQPTERPGASSRTNPSAIPAGVGRCSNCCDDAENSECDEDSANAAVVHVPAPRGLKVPMRCTYPVPCERWCGVANRCGCSAEPPPIPSSSDPDQGFLWGAIAPPGRPACRLSRRLVPFRARHARSAPSCASGRSVLTGAVYSAARACRDSMSPASNTMKYPLGGCSTEDVNESQSDCLVDLMLNAIPSLRCSITDSKGYVAAQGGVSIIHDSRRPRSVASETTRPLATGSSGSSSHRPGLASRRRWRERAYVPRIEPNSFMPERPQPAKARTSPATTARIVFQNCQDSE